MKKRLLSAFLVLAMVLTLLPSAAFATESPADPLKPADEYYTIDGKGAGQKDAAITLHKTAKRLTNDTYEVTLTVTAKEQITTKPTEVVFVIDGSGSMAYKLGDSTRWRVALDAVKTMQDNLGSSGITYKYVVYKGYTSNLYDTPQIATPSSFAELEDIKPIGGTYLKSGVDKALELFKNEADSNKVMIVVGDGASDQGYPADTDWHGRPTDFGQFKEDGGEVYTIGFTFSDKDFHDIASDAPGKDYTFDANDADDLKLSFEQISENIVGLISDPLGDDVQLVDGKVNVDYGKNIPATVIGNTINWTDPNGLDGTVTLTYQVKIKDDAKTAGELTIALNGNATLNYRTEDGENSGSVAFPVPQDTFSAATLTVSYTGVSNPPASDTEWLRLTEGAEFKTPIPAVNDPVGSYWVSKVDGAPEALLTAKDYKVTVILTDKKPIPDPYKLTYDANGGKIDGQDTKTVDVPVADAEDYTLGDSLKPTHDAVDGKAVVFIGWSSTNTDTIYSKTDTAPATIDTVDVASDNSTVVYAVWGYDTNGGTGDGTADVLETKYTVTYTDGVDDAEVFEDHKFEDLLSGDATPKFDGDLNRDGWNFTGWSPALEEKVTDSQTYTATWSEKVSTIYVVFQYSPEMGGSNVELGEGTVTSADAPGLALKPPVDKANETAPIGMKFTGWQVYGKGTVNTFDYTTLAEYADPNNWETDENGNPFTTVYIDAIYEPTTVTLPVVFVDEETGLEVEGGTERVTVPADNQTVTLSELTPPTGYVLSEYNTDPTTAKDGKFTIFVKQDRTITIYYNISDPSQGYLTQAPGKEFYQESFPEANSGLYPLEGVTAAPGYTFTGWNYNGKDSGTLPPTATMAEVLQHVAWIGAEGTITVSPIFERTTRDVTVRFVDKATGEEVGGSYTMAVAPDAYSVKTSDIDSSWIPEGYELAEQGDLMIDNDVVTVPVRRIAPTDAELKALLLNLQVDCTTEGHEPITTGLLDGSYTVTGDGLGVQGDYYYIQLNTAPYVAAYDAYSETHTGVDGSTMTIVLYHDDIKWIVPDTLMVRLNCERAVYNTIHVSFVNYVDGKDVSLGGGDVISTAPSVKLETPAPSGFTPEGKTFVGWKVRLGNSPMYEGEFTYDALYALMQEHGQDFYENQAWLTFEPVFADDYRVIHLKFVDEDENVIGAGDVISTYPDQEYILPDPAPFAPEGQSFVGWKVWVNDEPMYNGDFTFAALEQLLDSGFSGEEAWLTFQAVYADDSDADTYTLTYDANYSGGRDKSYDYEVGEDGRVRVTVEENMFRRSGYTFTGWNTRANGNGTDYEEGERLTLTGDLTLYAQWRKNGSTGTDTTSYTIDASASRGGDISPEGRVFVARGNDRTFRITADEGYVIDDVRVDGESVGAVRTYTFENVRRDHTIEVIFVPDGQQTVAYGPDDTGVSDWLNVDDHVSYLNGYPGGLFGPNDNMTRAEVAQMFYNLLLNQNVTVTVSFADVSADAWYAQAVNALASLGIVQGVGDGMFAPERTITRAEFTVIAMRFAELPTGGTNPFSDVRTSDWFYAQVVGAAQYGWITGYTNGTFGPNNTITRAEVTAIVNRMLSRSADEDFVDDNAAELVRFNDVSDTYWAYYDIMEATNSHEYEWDNNAEEWTDLA